MKTLITVDCHAMCHRIRYGMGGIELSTDNSNTEIVFGFMVQLHQLATKFETNLFAFAWDSSKNFREDIDSDYKRNRKNVEKTKEEYDQDRKARWQFTRLRVDVLPRLGFRNNFIQTGLEADDLIASIVCTNEYNHIIVSRDSDLYQLLHPTVRMYDSQTKKEFTYPDFMLRYGIRPGVWAKVKAIAGCPTDNVMGIPGVGEKTAIRYLREELPAKNKAFQLIVDSSDKINHNLELVELPFHETQETPIVEHELYQKDFLTVFEKLKFKSFLSASNFNEWVKAFRLV